MVEYVVSLDKLGVHDVEHVGGKNASLGEMISNLAGAGVSVPGGFATTAQAYRDFLEQSGLNDRIHAALDALDVDDVNALAKTGAQIRQWVMEAEFPARLDSEIRQAFAALANGNDNLAVAVRSSATAEDLPDASFAGQQETFLNIRGVDNVIRAAKRSSPPCSTTAPLPTACTRASTTSWSPCPPACSAWSARKPAPPG